MQLRHLQYFLNLAETEHLTQSATNLFITQSTISHSLKQLENELGVQLFDRVGRGLKISQAGIRFKAYASRALQEISNAKMEMAEFNNLQTGILTIGVIPTFLDSLIPSAAAQFSKQFPGIQLSIKDLRADLIEEELISGKIDLGISFHPTSRDEIEADHLFNEELVILVSKNHPLAKLKSINMSDLQDMALCLLPKNFSTRRLIDDSFKKANIKRIKIAVEIESVSSLIESCRSGVLATIVPERAAKINHDLNMIRLKNPTPIRKAGVLWRKGNSKSKASEAFVRLIKPLI